MSEAREREERARELLLDAQRQMMPAQIMSFLGRRLAEATSAVRNAEMREENMARAVNIPFVEATPLESDMMDRYMAARRKGFGSRTAPVPSGVDRETAEAKYIESRAAQQRAMFGSFAVPPNLMEKAQPPVSTDELTQLMTQLMKQLYTKQAREARELDTFVFGTSSPGGDGSGVMPRSENDYIPVPQSALNDLVLRTSGSRVAPPKPKAQTVAAPVVGRRKISFDDR